jgi:selenocysteine lyase/cysteine desulfurase
VTTPIADPLDLPRWRADTPGCEHRAHFNNAGAALMPNAVIAAMHEHIDLEARIGGYEAAAARASAVAELYQSLAMLVGAAPQNVAITTSATTAFLQTLAAIDVAPGDAIVTSVSDYTSYQIQLLALARKSGVRILRAEDLPEGGVDPDNVRFLLRTHRCRLVTLSWMPTHSGLIQRAEDVGGVCEEFDVPYHVDACQVVGQLPIDLAALRCDYLSATGRKYLRGPRGTGFLIVSDRALARGDYPALSTCAAQSGSRKMSSACTPRRAGSRSGSLPMPWSSDWAPLRNTRLPRASTPPPRARSLWRRR